MFEWHAHLGADNIITGEIRDDDDDAVVLGATDDLRVRVGRVGQDAVIEFDSGAASADGSTVTVDDIGDAEATPTVGATYTVTLTAAELDGLAPGYYDAELVRLVGGTEYVVDLGTLALIGAVE